MHEEKILGKKRDKQARLPFNVELDFTPLIRFWRNLQENTEAPVRAAVAQAVISAVERVPALQKPVTEPVVLEKNREVVEMLLTALIPESVESKALYAVAAPLNYDFIYQSSGFREILQNGTIVNEKHKIDLKICYSYFGILQKFYGMEISAEIPMVLEVGEKDDPGNRYFQMEINTRFMEVTCSGELPELKDKDRERILRDITDVDFLMKTIPPDRFTFRGLIGLQAIEITGQIRQSGIKHLILERGSILSRTKFVAIQDMLRSITGVDDLFMTVAALQDDRVLMLNNGISGEHTCIFVGTEHFKMSDFENTLYEQALADNRKVIVSDIKNGVQLSSFEKHLLEHGKRCLVAVPLVFEDRIIGMLGLSSRRPGVFNYLNTMPLDELLPVFGHALERSLDEFEDRIQRMIQERFTTIHPSVYWRFREEAIRMIEIDTRSKQIQPVAVVFENVYPLYSVTDIRSSSHFRNTAIQEDLTDHLHLARGILEKAYEQNPLPIYDEIIFRIDGYLDSLRENLSTGDEIQIINFLKNSVEGCFENFRNSNSAINEKIEDYYAKIDPAAGTVYRRRRDYDASVSMINDVISAYLDRVNPEAQAMFPHYFDKQATDGVDQNIYLGGSLVKDRPYHPVYLRNMRLWQLITMCEIALKMGQLKEELPVSLETTHLIMVQDMPISIRFDPDEKKFRVDGAYNIRYEIMKKRIDKAVIKGSGERLTQPDRIAIVYSHAEEIQEYREYVSYLQARGILLDVIEEFDLEDLQGIRGLKAIRVAVNREIPDSGETELAGMMREAIPG